MAKNDRRIRYTKQVIKQSLSEMLHSIPIEQITVKALCEKAEINRATFYNHYETLDVLMEEIEYETYKNFADLLSSALYDESYVTELLSTMLQYLKEHPNTRGMFLSKATGGRGLTHVLEEMHSQNMSPIAENDPLSRQQAQWILTYISSGTREVLRQWFAGDMKNEDLLIDTLSNFIHTGISKLRIGQ